MTIGEKILSMRKARGWSQEELADRVGVTRQAVSRWEADAAKPDAERIIALCQLFGVSADYLLGIQAGTQEPASVVVTSPQLLNKTTAGWLLIVVSVLVMAVAVTLLLFFQGGFFWLFWLGVAGVLVGVGMAPGAKYLLNAEWCETAGNICMGLGWPLVIVWACLVRDVSSILVWALLWPALVSIVLGFVLTRLHKKKENG